MIGTRLGPYQIEAEIGRGGMGYVYRAVQPSLGRTVAVKTLLPQLVADEEFIERFLREARATAKLSHPGIVTIHDVGEQDGIYYFAMEYLPGRTLEQIVRREGRLSPEAAVNYVGQIAAALGHAHSLGILHRDVKPSNVLVDQNDRAVLTDFGIAWAVSDSRLTRTGIAVGSPEYMSPEQVEGGRHDQRSDLYALGVLFYQLLVGETPYHGETPMSVAFQHVNGPVRSPAQANPAVPVFIDAIVRKLLAKDPKRRYACAGDLLEALGVQPAPAPAAPRTTSPNALTAAVAVAAERAPLVGIVAGLLVVLGAGLIYGASQYFGTTRAVAPATSAGPVTAFPGPAELAPIPEIPEPAGALPAGPSVDTPRAEAPSGAPAVRANDEPAAVPLVTYRIVSRPSGARVMLDRELLADPTPVEVRIAADIEHTLLLEMAGRDTVSWRFVPAELPEEQRAGGQLFFPLRPSATADAPGVTVTEPAVDAGSTEDEVASPGSASGAAGGVQAGGVTATDRDLDPVRVRGLMRAPEIVQRGADPRMPGWAVEQGLRRYVILELVIDREGRVRSARPIQAVHPELERMAIAVVLLWKFKAAERNGRPVDVYHNVSVQFRMPRDAPESDSP